MKASFEFRASNFEFRISCFEFVRLLVPFSFVAKKADVGPHGAEGRPRSDSKRMRIVISSQPRLLNILRGVVRYHAQMAGFGSPMWTHMTLAIDEAAANVIRHAYKHRCDGRVALEILNHPGPHGIHPGGLGAEG